MNSQDEKPFDPFQDSAGLLGQAGVTLEQLLESSETFALDRNFPTPTCLRPEEIASYSRHAILASNQQEHVDTCRHCRALLRMLVPNQENLREFREEVLLQRTAREDTYRSAERQSSTSRYATPRFRLYGVLTAAALLIVVLTLPVIMRRGTGTNAKNPSAVPQLPSSFPVSNELQDATLTLSDGKKATESTDLKVDGRNIAEQFQSRAAAVTTTFEIVRQLHAPQTKNQKILQRSFTDAIETLASRAGGVNDKSGQTIVIGLGPGCQSIANALSDKSVRVSTSDSSRKCVLHYESATMVIDPHKSVKQTVLYLDTLKKSQGDVMALREAAPNVKFSLQLSDDPSDKAMILPSQKTPSDMPQ